MNMVETIIQYSERLLAIKVKAHPADLFIVQCYAPTSDAADEEMDSFYESLRKLTTKKSSRDVVIIIGDMNAKVGCERIEDIVGHYGVGNINERGEELINFCRENDLMLANTWFEQKLSARHTWISPNGNVKNKIDFICVNKRYRNSFTHCKSRPGADCGSDHIPVVANVNIKLKKIKKKTRKIQWNLKKCKDKQTKEHFTSLFMEKLKLRKPINDNKKTKQ